MTTTDRTAVGAPHGREVLGRHRVATALSVLALVALVVLAVVVATGRNTALDDRVSELFRPDGQWGELQWRVDVVVEGLRPVVALALLGLVTVAASLRRRSWWPAVCVAVVVGASAVATAGLKALVGRADYHGDVGTLGGSFPSGHVATVLVAGGCVALLLRARPSPVAWGLVGLVTGLMAWALLVQTAHWFTDVVGGLLLGVAVLGLAVRLPFTRGSGGVPAAGSGETAG